VFLHLVKGLKNHALTRNLKRIETQHPKVLVVDKVEYQRKVTDRSHMSLYCQELEKECPPEANVHCPHFVIVDHQLHDEGRVDFAGLLREKEISLPVICKPIQACGSAESHYLGVVFKEEELHQFKPPFLIQEFYNHNGVIFKVFVIGEHISVVPRKSIKNFQSSQGDDDQLPNCFIFDSQNMKQLLSEGDLDVQPLPAQDALKVIAEVIGKKANLSLFGFDIVTNIETQKYAIVDLNFFPGYVGVEGVHSILLDFLSSLYTKHLISLQQSET